MESTSVLILPLPGHVIGYRITICFQSGPIGSSPEINILLLGGGGRKLALPLVGELGFEAVVLEFLVASFSTP